MSLELTEAQWFWLSVAGFLAPILLVGLWIAYDATRPRRPVSPSEPPPLPKGHPIFALAALAMLTVGVASDGDLVLGVVVGVAVAIAVKVRRVTAR